MAPLALFDLDNTLLDREAAYRPLGGGVPCRQGAAAPTPSPGWSTARRRRVHGPGTDLFAEVRASYALARQRRRTGRGVPPSTIRPTSPSPTGRGPRCGALRAAGWRVGVVTNGLGFPAAQARGDRTASTRSTRSASPASSTRGSPTRPSSMEAARRCGAALEGWMVGDSGAADIRGGQGVGLRTIWMAPGPDLGPRWTRAPTPAWTRRARGGRGHPRRHRPGA